MVSHPGFLREIIGTWRVEAQKKKRSYISIYDLFTILCLNDTSETFWSDVNHHLTGTLQVFLSRFQTYAGYGFLWRAAWQR